MRLRLGRPRVALIVAPHPDDEAIGTAQLIRALRRGGTAVRVLVVSNGAASHPRSRRWPPRRLVAERRRETRRAMRRLGVYAGAITFLGLPDGGLSQTVCCRLVARQVAKMRRLDLVVGPAACDAHPDHRAVAVAMASAPGGMRRLAYQVWPHHHRGRGAYRQVGGPGKRSLLGVYRTQLGVIRDDPGGFAIARHELDAFAHPIERFVVVRR